MLFNQIFLDSHVSKYYPRVKVDKYGHFNLFIKQNILAEQAVLIIVCRPNHFFDKGSVKKINTLSFQTIIIVRPSILVKKADNQCQ